MTFIITIIIGVVLTQRLSMIQKDHNAKDYLVWTEEIEIIILIDYRIALKEVPLTPDSEAVTIVAHQSQ